MSGLIEKKAAAYMATRQEPYPYIVQIVGVGTPASR